MHSIPLCSLSLLVFSGPILLFCNMRSMLTSSSFNKPVVQVFSIAISFVSAFLFCSRFRCSCSSTSHQFTLPCQSYPVILSLHPITITLVLCSVSIKLFPRSIPPTRTMPPHPHHMFPRTPAQRLCNPPCNPQVADAFTILVYPFVPSSYYYFYSIPFHS